MKNKLISTRGKDVASIDEAILSGLAADGGLYVPEHFPQYTISEFYQYDSLPSFAAHLLAPFFTESRLRIDEEFCKKVFTFPMPLQALTGKKYVLELFHGPTLSFKDFGARFFAQCLAGLSTDKVTKVLVATSGDTGSAVAGALHGKKGVKGFILFPQDKISRRQQAQITCWGDNITALAVKGSFDECQHLVKTAFAREQLADLTTANSINIARLLPQIIFYAYASIQLEKKYQQSINFIVPSGNLGNVTACYWAKKLGFPIGEILIATNANRVLSDYLNSGIYSPQASIKTIANAMDVGNPSNLERLHHLLQNFPAFKKEVNAESVSDEQIKTDIIACYKQHQYLLCPHTATAYHRLLSVGDDNPWVMIATAHPVKFNEVIEPLLGITIPIPERLQDLLTRPLDFVEIDPFYESLQTYLQ